MALLTRDQILKSDDLKTEVVSVPEWGGDVIVSTMSGFARDSLESSLVGKGGGTNTVNIRAKFTASTLVDESGKLLFTDKDVVALGKKSSAALDRVYDVVSRLNKISDKDVEEIAKN